MQWFQHRISVVSELSWNTFPSNIIWEYGHSSHNDSYGPNLTDHVKESCAINAVHFSLITQCQRHDFGLNVHIPVGLASKTWLSSFASRASTSCKYTKVEIRRFRPRFLTVTSRKHEFPQTEIQVTIAGNTNTNGNLKLQPSRQRTGHLTSWGSRFAGNAAEKPRS